MKLTNDEITFLQQAINTAKLVGVDNLIIEPGKIRAMDADTNVVMFQDTGVPTLPAIIGLNRLSALESRLKIVKELENFEVNIIPTTDISDPTNTWARSLMLLGKRTKIDYRCANPKTIKAPRIRAGSLLFSVKLTAEAVAIIQKGATAMKSEFVVFEGDEKGVTLKIADIAGDTLSYQFADEVNELTSTPLSKFVCKFPIALILTIFKTNPTGIFKLTDKSSLVFPVNGFDIYLTNHA